MIKKVGQRIWVRASRFLGTSRAKGTITDIKYQEAPSTAFYLVKVDGDPAPESVEVDLDGTCLIGPPLHGKLVRAP